MNDSFENLENTSGNNSPQLGLSNAFLNNCSIDDSKGPRLIKKNSKDKDTTLPVLSVIVTI